MKIKSENGLLWKREKDGWTSIYFGEADLIARANNFLYAERMVDAFDGKEIIIDDNTHKITTIEEDFLS